MQYPCYIPVIRELYRIDAWFLKILHSPSCRLAYISQWLNEPIFKKYCQKCSEGVCGYKKMINFVVENRGVTNGSFDERKDDKDRHYTARRHLDGDAYVVP